MKPLFFIFFLLFFFGCTDSGNQHKVIYSLPDNGEQLLAGDESKAWKLAKRTNDNMRVNMDECTLGFRQTFNRKHKISDNNEQNYDCGQSIKGSWNLSQDSKGQAYFSITSDHIPKLFNVKEGSKTKYFKIILFNRHHVYL